MGRSSPDYPGSEAQITQTDVKPRAALLLCFGRISCGLPPSQNCVFPATGQGFYVQRKAARAPTCCFIMITSCRLQKLRFSS